MLKPLLPATIIPNQDNPDLQSTWRQWSLPKDPHLSQFVCVSFWNNDVDFYQNHWSIFQNASSFLDFLQYTFLPSVLYHTYYPPQSPREELFVPALSTRDLITEVSDSSFAPHHLILPYIKKFLSYEASLDDEQTWDTLGTFCEQWNNQKFFSSFHSQIHFFPDIHELQESVENTFWEEELMIEEMDIDLLQWKKLCEDSTLSPFGNKKFFHFLNEKVDFLGI